MKKGKRIFFFHFADIVLICNYNSHGIVATNSSLHTYNNNNCLPTTPPPPQYHQQATHPTLGRHTKGKSLGYYHIWGVYVTEQDTPTYAPSSMETHYNFSCE